MQDARVFRGTKSQQFVIKVRETPRNVEFISSIKDICIASLRKEEFETAFTLSNHNPAKAAQTYLGGTKKIDEKARVMLQAISITEYEMPNEATVAATAAPAAKAPKAPKLKPPVVNDDGTTAPPAPVKAKKEPVIDPATGLPVVKEKKAPLVWERPKFANTDVFTTVASPNPRKAGTKSYDWFELYKVGGTVGDAIKAGAPRADISWMIHNKHLVVAPATVTAA